MVLLKGGDQTMIWTDPPVFKKGESYELYRQEILAWAELTDLPKCKQVTSYIDSERRKRGVPTVAVKLFQMGEAAVAHLLKRTTEIQSNDEAIRKYVKVGDFDSALKDFRAVNPSYVWSWKRNGSDMFEGRAGDRLIYVNSRGEQGLPTITVIDYKKAKVDWYQQPHKDPYGHVTGKPIDRIIYKKSLEDD